MPGLCGTRIWVYIAAGLPPLAVSAFWLSSVPTLWLYMDFTTILLWPTSLVPHFPPLYPVIVHAFESILGLNSRMLHALLFVQHAFLASSIIYLGSSFDRPLYAFIVSTAAVAGTWMGSFAHTVSTQGLDLPFLALLCGVAVRYCQGGWRLWALADVLRVSSRVGTSSARICYFRIYHSAIFCFPSLGCLLLSVSVATSTLGQCDQCDHILPMHRAGFGDRLTDHTHNLPRVGKGLPLFNNRTRRMLSHLRKLQSSPQRRKGRLARGENDGTGSGGILCLGSHEQGWLLDRTIRRHSEDVSK